MKASAVDYNLDARLKRVLGQSNQAKYKTAEDYTAKSLDEVEDETFIKKTVSETKESLLTIPAGTIDDEEDDMSYFSNLLGDD